MCSTKAFPVEVTNRDRISNDDELNLVLLGLVKYLGHSNPVISGVAFDQVREHSSLSCLLN